MSQLQDNLNNILNQKNNYLLPENLKKDVTLLGVTGTLEAIDTSDATATADDIAYGKTAYINGEKITGTVETISMNGLTPESEIKRVEFGGFSASTVTHLINTIGYSFENNILFKEMTTLEITLTKTNNMQIADAIGLTANKIKKNETILGVTGTYEGSGGPTTDIEMKSAELLGSNEQGYEERLYLGGYDISESTTLTTLYVYNANYDTIGDFVKKEAIITDKSSDLSRYVCFC